MTHTSLYDAREYRIRRARKKQAVASRQQWYKQQKRLDGLRTMRGELTVNEIWQIVEALRLGEKRYIDIGLAWLISEQRVCQIAKEYGIKRRHKVEIKERVRK